MQVFPRGQALNKIEYPHDPAPDHVVYRVHDAGKGHSYRELHRDVVVNYHPDGNAKRNRREGGATKSTATRNTAEG